MAATRAQQAAIAISMKKAGKKPALKKAQSGLSIGQGPGGTAAKSNIGPKIAAGVATAVGTIGATITAAKAKKAKKAAEKVKSDVQKEVAEKGRYGGAKIKKGSKIPYRLVNDPGFAMHLPSIYEKKGLVNDPGFSVKSSGYKGKALKKGGSTPNWQYKADKKPKMQNGGGVKLQRSIDPGFSKLPKQLDKPVTKNIDPGFSKVDTVALKNAAKRKIKTDPVSGGIQYKKGGTTPAWQRKEGKSPSGGLNAKGRASLKAEGHDIKAPQPEGGPRKKSFCARMSGMKKKLTSAKTANDPNSRINKSLRKWNC